jgi:hypothetical protein
MYGKLYVDSSVDSIFCYWSAVSAALTLTTLGVTWDNPGECNKHIQGYKLWLSHMPQRHQHQHRQVASASNCLNGRPSALALDVYVQMQGSQAFTGDRSRAEVKEKGFASDHQVT